MLSDYRQRESLLPYWMQMGWISLWNDDKWVPECALMHLLQHDLINMGYTIENVVNGLRNAVERQQWNRGSQCLVFSPIAKQWYIGCIVDIQCIKHSYRIYVQAQYDNANTVWMDLYCKDIQPLSAHGVNQKVNAVVEFTKLPFFKYKR